MIKEDDKLKRNETEETKLFLSTTLIYYVIDNLLGSSSEASDQVHRFIVIIVFHAIRLRHENM